ncbi:MAG TPA: cupredoxin domain-containing protein [Solirubrobacterales bacterium]|jgi:plastocyanin|nr:cupredoxin domain-containing protein [Solirubrobacterales bacterium]
MKLRALAIPILVALSLGLAACGGSDDSTGSGSTEVETLESEPTPGGEAARSEKVKIVEFAYGPDPVVVKVGGKVTWQNEDTAPHTATADDGSFDTDTLEKGKLKSATFKEAGTFPYFCEIHPTMHGTVEVVE